MSTVRSLLAAVVLGALFLAVDAANASARPSQPLVPTELTSLTAKKLGADCGAEPCCPKPCITYRHRGPKLCCTCEAPTKTVLKLKDPCTCCEVEVPVCLPACCKGEPTICWTSGAFCRDVAIYEWCCGFSVRVTFKHCGDLIVTTWGR